MIKLSNSVMVSIISKLLILVVIAKAISLIILWFLPSEGVEIKLKNNYQPPYQRVSFTNMIHQEKKAKAVKKVVDTSSSISITNMLLKGLYGTDTKGFVIVAMKATPKKTEVIGIGEEFKGYKLKSIQLMSAIFEKGSKDYVLELDSSPAKKGSSSVNRVPTFKTPISSPSVNKVVQDEPVGVSRKDIAFFAKNPKQIWREISIKEVKDGKKILGFKVRKIKKGSKFATLGLQKGDLITKANNVKLESYKDAIDIYKKIDKLDTIQIVVMRDNQEVELVYDIN